MMQAYAGEDVPITIDYENSSGTATDPDSPGTTWPSIEIIDTSDDSTEQSATVMTQDGTGHFEYVWDTSSTTAGEYRIEITAEFSSETKISKTLIELE